MEFFFSNVQDRFTKFLKKLGGYSQLIKRYQVIATVYPKSQPFLLNPLNPFGLIFVN